MKSGPWGSTTPSLRGLLRQEHQRADNDLILARAIEESKTPVVLGYFFHVEASKNLEHISDEEIAARERRLINAHYTFTRLASPELAGRRLGLPQAHLPETNIASLAEASAAAGYFNMFPDYDGTVREVPLTIVYQDRYYMPLSLQALSQYLDDAPALPERFGGRRRVGDPGRPQHPHERSRPHDGQLSRARPDLSPLLDLRHPRGRPGTGSLQGQDRPDRGHGRGHLRPAGHAF